MHKIRLAQCEDCESDVRVNIITIKLYCFCYNFR